MAYTCEQCGKVMHNRRAFAGHMFLAHQKRIGFLAELDERWARLHQMNESLAGDVLHLRDTMAYLAGVVARLNDLIKHDSVDNERVKVTLQSMSDETGGYLGQLVQLRQMEKQHEPKEQVRHRNK